MPRTPDGRQTPERRTANIAVHVKLTEEEAAQMRALAESRGLHIRQVVVEGMRALEEVESARSRLGLLETEVSASATWKTACSSILGILQAQAAKRALTATELEIWTLAMGLELTPP